MIKYFGGFVIISIVFYALVSNNLELNKTIDERNQLITQYKTKLKDEHIKIKELQESISQYQQITNDLDSQYRSVLLQLSTNNTRQRTVSTAVNQPKSTKANPCGRCEKLGIILKKATDIAYERDRIAIMYNELRTQCKLTN